jgi:hypothetical protein
MTEVEMCGVCGKEPMAVKCSECGIPLCAACVREVKIETVSAGTTHKGITTSTLRPAETIKKVCLKCMKEVDLL